MAAAALGPGLAAALLGLLGLLIGSFLNVVIHRLPKMLHAQWAAELTALADPPHADAASDPAASAPAAAPYNLMHPRSHCPHCLAPIAWWDNVPLLSWLALRGACRHCGARIGLRYPLVEAACAALFAYCGARWGLSPAALAWSGFAAFLLALALIDWDTTLLPDDITLPLLWAGLLAAQLDWSGATAGDALWGAAAGYTALWSVYWAFKLATGKEGMGYGDFKLYAALGAWFGWQALIPIILMASVIGAGVGIALKLGPGLREGGYIPFGPFLAGAGLAALIAGPQALLRAFGL